MSLRIIKFQLRIYFYFKSIYCFLQISLFFIDEVDDHGKTQSECNFFSNLYEKNGSIYMYFFFTLADGV